MRHYGQVISIVVIFRIISLRVNERLTSIIIIIFTNFILICLFFFVINFLDQKSAPHHYVIFFCTNYSIKGFWTVKVYIWSNFHGYNTEKKEEKKKILKVKKSENWLSYKVFSIKTRYSKFRCVVNKCS